MDDPSTDAGALPEHPPGRMQGWCTDPYGLHEHRYFSDGHPTKLVRDQGRETYDDPPLSEPTRPVVPVEGGAGEGGPLVRADDWPADSRTVGEAVFDEITAYWPPT